MGCRKWSAWTASPRVPYCALPYCTVQYLVLTALDIVPQSSPAPEKALFKVSQSPSTVRWNSADATPSCPWSEVMANSGFHPASPASLFPTGIALSKCRALECSRLLTISCRVDNVKQKPDSSRGNRACLRLLIREGCRDIVVWRVANTNIVDLHFLGNWTSSGSLGFRGLISQLNDFLRVGPCSGWRGAINGSHTPTTRAPRHATGSNSLTDLSSGR